MSTTSASQATQTGYLIAPHVGQPVMIRVTEELCEDLATEPKSATLVANLRQLLDEGVSEVRGLWAQAPELFVVVGDGQRLQPVVAPGSETIEIYCERLTGNLFEKFYLFADDLALSAFREPQLTAFDADGRVVTLGDD